MPVQELTFKINVNSALAEKEIQRITTLINKEIKKINKQSADEISSLRNTFATEFDKIARQVPVVGNALGTIVDKASDATKSLKNVGEAAGETGAEFAAMAGPIGVAVAAILAGELALIGLHKELFTLAKDAAEVQGKLFDMSQQTGVSVETLSALEELAKTTGGSLEGVVASLGIFQKNLEAAEDPTTKQAAAFKSLNVEVTDTEETLRATLTALAKMPAGFRQTALALELFGRGGKQFLAILKESHGDIDETIRHLQRLGLANSENAKRADDMNDALVHLDTALEGIKVTLGNEVIPIVTEAAKVTQEFIEENKDGLQALNLIVRTLAITLGSQLISAVRLLGIAWQVANPGLKVAVELYERMAAAWQLMHGTVPNVPENAIPAQSISPTAGDKLPSDLNTIEKILARAQADKNALLKPFNLREIFGLDKTKGGATDPAIQLLRQLQNELRNIEGATKAESIAAELLDSKFKNTSQTLKDQILVIAKLIDQKKLQIDVDAELKQLTEEHTRLLEQESDRVDDFIFAQEKALKPLTEFDEAIKFIGESFLRTGEHIDAIRESVIRFNATLIQAKKDADELAKSLKDVADNTPAIAPQGIPLPNEKQVFDDTSLGIPPAAEQHFKDLQTTLDQLGKSLGDLTGASSDFAKQFGDTVGGAIGDVAFAVGDLVNQWVLLGDTGPAAMRKLTASVLAGVAAQAAVKAIFQLAEGFAALFINPAEAAAHFTSAAIFGSIAGVAAVAGRATAGNLFKQQPSAGGGSQGTGQLNPLTLNRNQPQQVNVVVQVKDSQFGKAIDAHVTKGFQTAGTYREMWANDGGPM